MSSLQILQGKPFWIWNREDHLRLAEETNEQCCFNHIVGLPQKDGKEYPLFDYEKLLYDGLISVDGRFKDKHLWVKKATGLGVTEFMLRIMAWLCTKDERQYGHGNDNGQMCIVTGPNIDIAIKLIKRMKGIFERKLGLVFQNKETVLDLNGFTIEAYPSNHLDSYRALTNPKFIFLDEADMFRKSEQDDVRHVSERYIGKSDPYIVMVSTPNAPGGLFESIEKESEETCIYKRLKRLTYGLDKIYTKQEIDKARQSPSFEREYDLKYTGKIGNVFHTTEIDEAVARGETYDPERPIDMCAKSMGIDPGWGSSPFGIVITQFVDKTIQIIFAEEYERPDFEKMVMKVVSMLFKYRITKVYVDGSNPSFISSLKRRMGENPNYQNYSKEELQRQIHGRMIVCPINFSQKHRDMLMHTKLLFERRSVAINAKFDKLITSLKTAVENDGSLDKEATSYNDIFDAFRLSLENYALKKC